MLNDTLFRVPRSHGLQLIQHRGERGAHELTSWRLRLEPGRQERFSSPGEETVAVLQQGSGSFEVDGLRWPVSRASVFGERATALYLPPGQTLLVSADTAVEAILVSTPAPPGGDPAIVFAADVQPQSRGRDLYARDVHNIFVTDGHVRRLMVGETLNPPGHWSSFPPHKHDGKNGEPVLEEVYHFRVDPAHGFGHQTLYTEDGENVTHIVKDGDAVLLPYGYHPVSSPPGYQLYYLWAMAGAERRLALYEDPAHAWIHGSK